MRIKPGFIMKKICGEAVVIPIGDTDDFNGMIKLNETAAFMWEKMQSDFTEEALTTALLDEYEVSESEASQTAEDFIKILSDAGVIQ